jgi:hypothetical protein
VVIRISLQLTFTVTFDPDLELLQENWFISAEWGTLEKLPPFLSSTETCVRVNIDISGIKS